MSRNLQGNVLGSILTDRGVSQEVGPKRGTHVTIERVPKLEVNIKQLAKELEAEKRKGLGIPLSGVANASVNVAQTFVSSSVDVEKDSDRIRTIWVDVEPGEYEVIKTDKSHTRKGIGKSTLRFNFWIKSQANHRLKPVA